jgi:proline iminopeptidase
MSELLPDARLAICENGSHLTMWDDQETYFRHLIEFIKDNERGAKMK